MKQLYKELLDAFSKWNHNADSWEDEDYKSFYCSNMESYGYVKEIHLNRYEQKCLRCTLTNINEVEKDVFVKIVQKYCNHIVADEK